VPRRTTPTQPPSAAALSKALGYSCPTGSLLTRRAQCETRSRCCGSPIRKWTAERSEDGSNAATVIHDRKRHGRFVPRKLHAQLHAVLTLEGARLVAIDTGPVPKRNESPPIVVRHASQPPGDLRAIGFHNANFPGEPVVRLPLRIPFHVADAAVCQSNDADRNRSQGWGVGNCLGFRVSRMSSSEEAGTWEETGAADVKVVWVGIPAFHERVGRISVPRGEIGGTVRRIGLPPNR
jgi:hypothetical protein